ncbi:hypothetical protein BDQ17DRAFT_844969 [Cyathus striatus]|nr:hypothetical protein BDQ17DRAFT_844969 [Cyathus striatus]
MDVYAGNYASYEFTSWIYGTLGACMVYGAIASLTVIYFGTVWNQIAANRQFSRQKIILSLYTVVAFYFSTVGIIAACRPVFAYFSSKILISIPDIPGGLDGNICFMLTAWMVNSLLAWRFCIIYQDFKIVKMGVLLISTMLQIASIATGGLVLWNIQMENYSEIYQPTIYFEALYLSHSLTMACLVVGRLLLCRYKVRKALGTRHHGKEYLSIVAMLAESQGIIAVAKAIIIGSNVVYFHVDTLFIFGPPVISPLVYPVLAQLQVLSPVVLTYRILQGKVCDADAIAEVTKAISVTSNNNDSHVV